MTSAALRILAIITMLVDHIGAFFFPEALWLRAIGRLSMPLFVFGIAEGFVHTSSVRKYFWRLLTFAIIAQVPFALLDTELGRTEMSLNIMFSLALSILALACVKKGVWMWLMVPIIMLAVELLRVEYGWVVVALALLFYLARKYLYRKFKILYGIAIYLSLFAAQICLVWRGLFVIQFFAILAVIPILFYNGKKGRRLPRHAEYIFYPAHLFIIWIILQFLH